MYQLNSTTEYVGHDVELFMDENLVRGSHALNHFPISKFPATSTTSSYMHEECMPHDLRDPPEGRGSTHQVWKHTPLHETSFCVIFRQNAQDALSTRK